MAGSIRRACVASASGTNWGVDGGTEPSWSAISSRISIAHLPVMPDGSDDFESDSPEELATPLKTAFQGRRNSANSTVQIDGETLLFVSAQFQGH